MSRTLNNTNNECIDYFKCFNEIKKFDILECIHNPDYNNTTTNTDEFLVKRVSLETIQSQPQTKIIGIALSDGSKNDFIGVQLFGITEFNHLDIDEELRETSQSLNQNLVFIDFNTGRLTNKIQHQDKNNLIEPYLFGKIQNNSLHLFLDSNSIKIDVINDEDLVIKNNKFYLSRYPLSNKIINNICLVLVEGTKQDPVVDILYGLEVNGKEVFIPNGEEYEDKIILEISYLSKRYF